MTKFVPYWKAGSGRRRYSKWGKPEFVNGRWQIRRTYRRANDPSGPIGVQTYYLSKKK